MASGGVWTASVLRVRFSFLPDRVVSFCRMGVFPDGFQMASKWLPNGFQMVSNWCSKIPDFRLALVMCGWALGFGFWVFIFIFFVFGMGFLRVRLVQ